MTVRHLQIITLAATASAVAFGLIAFSFAGDSDIDVGSVTTWKPGLIDLGREDDANIAAGQYTEILARPVFSPSRRPIEPRPPESPPPEAVEPPPEALPPPEPAVKRTPPDYFVLRGVLLEPAKQAALIQTQTHPDGIWLEGGSDVEGWVVKRIDKGGVEIESNGETAGLTLYVDNSSN